MSVTEVPVDEVSFLLRFDRRRRETTVSRLTDPVEAETAYDRAERELGRDANIELVLVTAEDLETIRVTHASYFTGQTVRMVD